MAIGRNTALTNASNCAYLPTAARALYELSRLAPEEVEHGIESGAITPACRAPGVACPGGPSRPCLVRQIGPLD